VDVGASDVLKHLKLGGMIDYRGQNDTWAVMGDVLYAKVAGDGSKAYGPFTLSLNAQDKVTIVEGDVGYRVTPLILAFVGARYYKTEVEVTATSTGPLQVRTGVATRSQDWVDPIIGVSADIPLAQNWTFRLRGDVGGFSAGAKFSWQGVAAVGWQAAKNLQLALGFKYLREEYTHSNSTDPDYFRYDIAMAGPALGIAYTF
jgi:hypothetical protein